MEKRKFKPRLSEPSTTDKFWLKPAKGGLNECLEISSGSVLPNCVGYVWGRLYELIGEKPRLSTGNAENWYPNTADGYARSDTPKLGAIACWRKGREFNESDGCGHVAVVEEIKPNGDIVCSNSAYGGTRFYLKEYAKSAGYNSGALVFQGFILPPIDFDEKSVSEKTVGEIAKEVIRGDWGNGADREKRLTSAGYDYSEVQAKVNELLSIPPKSTEKSVNEIAKEVIRGDWGNGDERKKRLTSAGYDYSKVQAKVNELVNPATTSTEIKVGDRVTLKEGATDYYGAGIAEFVYKRKYKVTKLVGNRAEICYGDSDDVVAAVRVEDLRKV